MTTPLERCALCGEPPPPPCPPTALLVPAISVWGEKLEVPGVYALCGRCRKAVSVAENEMKRAREERS